MVITWVTWVSLKNISVTSVQSLSRVRLFATPWTTARQASLSITISRSPPKPMSIELVIPSSHIIFCHLLLLLPSIFPSIRVFSNESALCIRWPKYWSFSFNISLSNEHPGLISFRMDWLDLLAVHGTLKSHKSWGSRWLSGKESACNAGDTGDLDSIHGWGRTPGGGHGNPLQDSCLENPMDRGAWRPTVHRVTQSDMTKAI